MIRFEKDALQFDSVACEQPNADGTWQSVIVKNRSSGTRDHKLNLLLKLTEWKAEQRKHRTFLIKLLMCPRPQILRQAAKAHLHPVFKVNQTNCYWHLYASLLLESATAKFEYKSHATRKRVEYSLIMWKIKSNFTGSDLSMTQRTFQISKRSENLKNGSICLCDSHQHTKLLL